MLTDGKNSGGKEILQMYTDPIKNDNKIEIFAVGMKAKMGSQAQVLVSKPVESHLLTMESFKEVYQVTDKLVKSICK